MKKLFAGVLLICLLAAPAVSDTNDGLSAVANFLTITQPYTVTVITAEHLPLLGVFFSEAAMYEIYKNLPIQSWWELHGISLAADEIRPVCSETQALMLLAFGFDLPMGGAGVWPWTREVLTAMSGDCDCDYLVSYVDSRLGALEQSGGCSCDYLVDAYNQLVDDHNSLVHFVNDLVDEIEWIKGELRGW